MADINVQRKQGTPGWVWLLVLLALALLAWLLWGLLAGDDEPEVADTVPAATAPAVVPVVPADPAAPPAAGQVPPVVQGYLATCTAEGGAPADMGLEHQFAVTCFRDLRAAIDTVMVRGRVSGVDVSSRVNEYQTAVQRLEQSQPASTEHAGYTRQAADAASALMQAILTTGYGGMQEVTAAVAEVEQAASAIQPGTQMLEQRDAVRAFFRESGDALRLMAERSPAAGGTA